MFATLYIVTYRVAVDTMFVDINGDRDLVPNYLVLITDGMSDNRTMTWHEAMRARAKAITIIVVSHEQRISDSISRR